MNNIFGAETASVDISIVDADSIIYFVGHTCDMLDSGKKFALKLLDQSIDHIYEDTSCKKVELYLGTDTNFRKEIATMVPYKSNRDGSHRPVYYDALRHRLIKDYDAQLCERQEAEDVVGIRSFEFNDFDKFRICRIDKDLAMLPGFHYNYRTRQHCYINKLQALRNFYAQLVTGDMGTDAIPGLYHQLELDKEFDLAKKFRYSRYKSKLIKELATKDTEIDMYDCAFILYDQYGQLKKHGTKRIIETGRLLWMRRYVGELWVPPTDRDFSYLDIDKREDKDDKSIDA